MGAAVLAGIGLSLAGVAVVRNSTAGRYVEPVAAADDPGYRAYVVATPTLAAVHTDAEGRLASVAVLSLAPGDAGGAVTVIPPSVVVAGSGDGTVADAYARGGADTAVEAVTDVLDIAVDDHVAVDGDRWASLVEPVGPVTVPSAGAVGPWPAGDVDLDAADVGAFLTEPQAGESEIDRLTRGAAFWEAWLAAVAEADTLPGESDVGIERFAPVLAEDPEVQVLPVASSATGGYAPDRDRIASLVARTVPYPRSPAPGRRVRVRLLDGTGDPGLTEAVVPLLVEEGAEITIAGNAPSFDVTETRLTHHGADDEADARRMADALGVGTVEDDGSPASGGSAGGRDEEIDVTIVLGEDVQDLIRRLETAD